MRSQSLYCVLVAQLCPTLCDSMDYSPPGSSVRGDSPGKNIGVVCHDLLQGIFPTQGSNPGLPYCRCVLYHRATWEALYVHCAVLRLVAHSCLTLCNPMDYSLQAPLSMGILQARILEWVAISFFRGSSLPGIQPRSPALQADSLLSENFVRSDMYLLSGHR